MRGDTKRCEEMWGDAGRCGEMHTCSTAGFRLRLRPGDSPPLALSTSDRLVERVAAAPKPQPLLPSLETQAPPSRILSPVAGVIRSISV